MPAKKNKSYGWIKREGKLGGPGYTKKTTATRHRILKGVVAEYGYRSALGSIVALERSTHISKAVRKVLESDRVWLRETFGAASQRKAADKEYAAYLRRKARGSKELEPRSHKKRTKPRRVPSVARRTRKVKAAMKRLPRGRAAGGMEASFGAYASATPAARRRHHKATEAREAKSRTIDRLRREYDQEIAAGEYGAAEWTLRAIRDAQGVPAGRRPSRADRIGMLTPGWRPNPSAKSRKNPSECGLHGIPMHGGSCVACLYEADIL